MIESQKDVFREAARRAAKVWQDWADRAQAAAKIKAQALLPGRDDVIAEVIGAALDELRPLTLCAVSEHHLFEMRYHDHSPDEADALLAARVVHYR